MSTRLVWLMLGLLLSGFLVGGAAAADAPTRLPSIVVQRNVEVRHFYGYARVLASGKYAYTEVHEQYRRDGRWIGGAVTYFAPDGTRLGTKVIDFPPGADIPLYHLDLDHPQYTAGVSRVSPDSVYLFRQQPGEAAPQQTKIARHAAMTAGRVGLERFIATRLAGFAPKATREIWLAMPGELDARTFRITRLADGSEGGAIVVRFKVERTSLLRLLDDEPMFFDFDGATGSLLEYRGPSEIRDPQSGKRYRVRVTYGDKPPADAPARLPPLEAGPPPAR
ncbi:MAG TPA: hypothetical protein VF265_07870 [Nevskiaceae bacterium]